MITRRLPRSTLFPYTTLFRSDGQRERSSITPSRRVALVSGAQPMGGGASPSTGGRAGGAHPGPDRSEEHTSELQSRVDLVCRLLLEKKNVKSRLMYRSFNATT